MGTSLRSLNFCTRSTIQNVHNTEPSNIYYMELLDEHPDSSDTMKHVSEI